MQENNLKNQFVLTKEIEESVNAGQQNKLDKKGQNNAQNNKDDKQTKHTFAEKLLTDFSSASDFKNPKVNLPSGSFSLFYIDNLIDKDLLNDCLLQPIVSNNLKTLNCGTILNCISLSGGKKESEYFKIVENILCGFVIIEIKGKYLSFPCQGYEKRSITEPPTSAVLKGPREGFVEDVNTNVSLIRRRVKTADLKIEDVTVGVYSKTIIKVVYIKSIADGKIVEKVLERLKKIEIDGVLDSFYIQSLLEEKHSSLFKQMGNTEKPEVAISKLLEGRVVIIVDGSPLVLTLPYILLEDFQSADDYFNKSLHSTFIRILRVLGFVLSITLPGLYVALQSFHYALLPIDFLISLQSSIEGLSFPPLIEILFVLFLFEILNEASVRMPKYLGMALSIIGALVLGDTAVQAGLISPPAVIMVAISGITLYTVPDHVNTASVLRLFFTIIGGLSGFYGILIMSVLLVSYLLTFDSYGSAYFAPYSPNIQEDKKDGIIKKDLRNMLTRPKSIPNTNYKRQKLIKNAKKGGKDNDKKN